ncbi:hypothetical protein NQ315_001213, partial [Exocentrus adspersus]
RTAANEPMYMPAGTAYVYMTYGMYHCFNISSEEPGAAVLLRALEPISGMETMQKFRAQKLKTNKNAIQPPKLCDGPSKLCISMNITKESMNKLDLTDLSNDTMWLEDDPDFDRDGMKIVCTSRIGIASAGVEWATKPLRFYILHNDSVSKRDKAAEEELDFDTAFMICMFCKQNRRLLKEDYDRPCQDLAVYLLGKILVRKLENGGILKGVIVETECYLGGDDKASHSYNGNAEPGAVALVRALQPVCGTSIMEGFRSRAGAKSKAANPRRGFTNSSLCNGPSKLCIAMDITKDNSNELDLGSSLNERLWIEKGAGLSVRGRILNTSRIGIGPSAEEWVNKPLRFYLLGNRSVSKRDKKAEEFATVTKVD